MAASNTHSRAREDGRRVINNLTAKETQLRQDALLEAYERFGTITKAAEVAGVACRQHYSWLANDPGYASRFAESDNVAVQVLEDEAKRRAVDGCVVPKGVAGQAIDVIEYSDRLLEFLLKGRRPEKYGDRFKSEISGPAGGPIAHQITVEMVPAVADAGRQRVIEAQASEEGE